MSASALCLDGPMDGQVVEHDSHRFVISKFDTEEFREHVYWEEFIQVDGKKMRFFLSEEHNIFPVKPEEILLKLIGKYKAFPLLQEVYDLWDAGTSMWSEPNWEYTFSRINDFLNGKTVS